MILGISALSCEAYTKPGWQLFLESLVPCTGPKEWWKIIIIKNLKIQLVPWASSSHIFACPGPLVLERFLFVRTDWPDHSRRNENQNYPARPVKSEIACMKEIVFQQKMTGLAGKFWLLESGLSEWFSLRMTISWTVVHWARKLEKLLAQQENLLVPEDWMGNFFEPGGGSFCKFLDFQISHGDQTCLSCS